MLPAATKNETTQAVPWITIPESTLRRIARERMEGSHLIGIVLRQAAYEGWVRLIRHVNFRQNDNLAAVHAYKSMSVQEFEGINARQEWANWRTIPRNLNGRIPARPIFALDLCCGIGQSTEVLACYLPSESMILGLEFSPSFVDRARGRQYPGREGSQITVRFRAQSVLEAFRDESENALGDSTVDLVNCSGAVGCHFDAYATATMAREVVRVLRPGGIAMIDSGPAGTPAREVTRIFEGLGLRKTSSTRSCFVDPHTQLVFQK